MTNKNIAYITIFALASSLACAKAEKECAVAKSPNECKAKSAAETKEKSGSKWLIRVNGKDAESVASFEKFVDDAAKADAQLKMLVEQAREFVMPQLVEIKKQEVIINHWADVNKIKEKPEYKKKRADGIKALEQMLNQEEFVQAFKKEPTEAEIAEYYNKNKLLDPVIVVQQPGVRARGIVFDNQEDAQKFMKASQCDATSFADEAKKANKKIVEYGLVNEMSLVDPSIKEKLASLTKFPGMELIKTGDKEFIVVFAESKQEGKFKPLNEVKELVKQRITGSKLQEAISGAMQKFSQEYCVEINPEYIAELNKKAEERAALQAKQVEAAQQAAQQQPKAPKNAQVAA